MIFVYYHIIHNKQRTFTKMIGLLYTKSSKTNTNVNVPLKSLNYYISSKDRVMSVTIVQKYLNEEKSPIEALFKFPTPAGVSVYECKALTDGGDTIHCKIKEKSLAKKEYNDAIGRGDTAYYSQRESGDVLSFAIGNMAPSEGVEITIKYVTMLENEENHKKFRFNIPLTIMSRYTPTQSNKTSFSTSSYDPSKSSFKFNQPKVSSVETPKISSKPFDMTVEGDIQVSDEIISLDSKTHKIKLSKMTKSSLHFEIQDLENLNKDIVLTLERSNSICHAFTQEFKGDLKDELYRHCTAVNIVPDFKNLPPINVTNIYYALLLDNSASMCGFSMDKCKYAAQQFIAVLPVGCEYDVYSFNDRYKKFTPKTSTKDPNALKLEATKWIDGIYSEGGTEILPVMKDAYDHIKKSAKLGVIVILSDGEVTNEQQIFQLVRSNPNVSVFSIGIGSNVSQGLIKGLATHSGGHAEFIGTGDKNIIEKVLAQLKRSQDTLRKYQKDYTLDINTIGGNHISVPEKLPTLFDQTDNTIFIFSEYQPASIVYTEKLDNKNSNESKTNVVNIIPETIESDTNYALHRMAGIELIDYLQTTPVPVIRKSLISDLRVEPSDIIDPTIERKKRIIQISTDLNVLSDHTAFIGVENRKNKVTDEMKLREIPLQYAENELSVSSNVMNSMHYLGSTNFVQYPTLGDSDDSDDSDEESAIVFGKSVARDDRDFGSDSKQTLSVPTKTTSMSMAAPAKSLNQSEYDPVGYQMFRNWLGSGQNQNQNQYQYERACKGRDESSEEREKCMEEEEEYDEESDKDMGFSLFDGDEEIVSDNQEKSDNKNNNNKIVNKSQNKLAIKYIVNVSLFDTYIVITSKVGGNILTAKNNGTLLKTIISKSGKIDKDFVFSIGDVIQLKSEKDPKLNGTYKIVKVGTDNEPWTLALYED